MANDLISRQAAIDEIEYELKMINSALDSITLDFNARERLRQRRGEAREILNSIQQLPSAQPEIIRCRDCRWRKDQSDSTAWLPCRAIVTPSDFSCCHAERRADGSD